MKSIRLTRHSFILIAIFVLTFSCNQEEANTEPVIDPELLPYVNRFVDEAQLRGKVISLANLVAKFENQNSCGSGWVNPPKISIDKTCWNDLPDIAKELIVFHQLGQALLGRSDDNSKLPTGDYISIMCENPIYLYNEYTPGKRIYYLDELFEVAGQLPDWAFIKTNETSIFQDPISTDNLWQHFVSGNANHTASLSGEFSSAPFSLSIKSNGTNSGFSYWVYSWKPTNVEEGTDLVLKVKIKASDLSGGGAYFAFRANVTEKSYPIFFYTTQTDDPATGTNDFKDYSIKVNYFPNKCDRLDIFLIMDGTSTGTVYFDDIQVLKYE